MTPDRHTLYGTNQTEREMVSHGVYSNIVRALGNFEPRCVTLLCLSEEPLTQYILNKKFVKNTGNVWQTAQRTQAGYCHNVLIPAGLVEYDGSKYSLSPLGRYVGEPIARKYLQCSAELPFSLYKIFGKKPEGVLNKTKILGSLAEIKKSVREIDIEAALGIDRKIIGPHLVDFASLGLVNLRSHNFEQKGLFQYRLSPGALRDNVTVVDTRPSLTKQVADLLFTLKTADSELISTLLLPSYAHISEANFKSHIGIVLAGLTNQKICEPVLFRSGRKHSDLSITDLGITVVDTAVVPIQKGILEQPKLLDTWRNIPWKDYSELTIERFRDDSSNANRRGIDEGSSHVYRLIKDNPGIRPNEIAQRIGKRYDLINALLQKGIIRSEHIGKATKYFIVDE